MVASLAERFFKLFAGLARCHGSYVVGNVVSVKGKRAGQALNVKTPPTAELWAQHLAGEYGLGIVPIRDDGTCRWGAIDVDVYAGLEHARLDAECRALGLPLIVCRTKSGGAHLYLFLVEDTPAELVRGKLMEWAVALGYPGVEVFPKQTRLAGPEDFGNWLNMPYQAGERSLRVAISDGKPLSMEGFLELAATRAVTELELRAVELPTLPSDELLEGSPPCLQHLARAGIPEGSRNNALFNLGVYARQRYGEDWRPHLDELNQAFLVPPLGSREVAAIAKSLSRKAYFYKCKEHPISACCNRQICLTREYGVGGSDDPGVVFGELIKIETDPPTWIWDVDGARLTLQTPELMDQRSFRLHCINKLNKVPDPVKPATWVRIVKEKLATVRVEQVPVDATPRGQLWEHLQAFCTARTRARERDEIALGKPWADPETGITWFKAQDFVAYLKQRREVMKLSDLYVWLRERGIEKHPAGGFNIKGKFHNVWGVKSFTEQTEPFDVPRTEEKFDG